MTGLVDKDEDNDEDEEEEEGLVSISGAEGNISNDSPGTANPSALLQTY